MKDLVCQLGVTIEDVVVTLYMNEISQELRGNLSFGMTSLFSCAHWEIVSKVYPYRNGRNWGINGTDTSSNVDKLSYAYMSREDAEQAYENLCALVKQVDDWLAVRNTFRRETRKKLKVSYKDIMEANNVLELTKHLTFGFEWETNLMDGKEMADHHTSYEEEQEERFDRDAWEEEVERRAEGRYNSSAELFYWHLYDQADYINKALKEHESVLSPDDFQSIERIWEKARGLWARRIDTFYKLKPFFVKIGLEITKFTPVKEAVEMGLLDPYEVMRCLKEEERENTRKGEFYSSYSFEDYVRETYGVCALDVKEDASVNGPEITTQGGVTATKFMELANIVEDNFLPESDKTCSFHLHVGLKNGQKFLYTPEDKLAIYEYMFSNLDMVPKAVRDRWAWSADGDNSDYFLLTDTNTKYSFLHFHNFGTLEYRCFGNVNTADEARSCLYLAIKATQYMVTRKFGTTKSVLEGLSNEEQLEILKHCATNDISLHNSGAKRLISDALFQAA